MENDDSVLVVDDETMVLEVLKTALNKVGFQVFTATRVADAAALIRGHRFSCALIDKNMPESSGLELLKLIRQKQPDCSCLIMTAYPNAASLVEALQMGAVEYLEKPFPHLSIIQEKVKAAARRQRRVSELSAELRQLEFRHQQALSLLREAEGVLEHARDTALLPKLRATLAELTTRPGTLSSEVL